MLQGISKILSVLILASKSRPCWNPSPRPPGPFAQLHARTREARLQVSLAELPYLRARMRGDWALENTMKHGKERKGAEHFERMDMLLNRRKAAIKRKIDDLRKTREMLRDGEGNAASIST